MKLKTLVVLSMESWMKTHDLQMQIKLDPQSRGAVRLRGKFWGAVKNVSVGLSIRRNPIDQALTGHVHSGVGNSRIMLFFHSCRSTEAKDECREYETN